MSSLSGFEEEWLVSVVVGVVSVDTGGDDDEVLVLGEGVVLVFFCLW